MRFTGIHQGVVGACDRVFIPKVMAKPMAHAAFSCEDSFGNTRGWSIPDAIRFFPFVPLPGLPRVSFPSGFSRTLSKSFG